MVWHNCGLKSFCREQLLNRFFPIHLFLSDQGLKGRYLGRDTFKGKTSSFPDDLKGALRLWQLTKVLQGSARGGLGSGRVGLSMRHIFPKESVEPAIGAIPWRKPEIMAIMLKAQTFMEPLGGDILVLRPVPGLPGA